MPIYEYECRKCGEKTEVIQKFNEAPKRKCPECGKLALKKLVSAAAFHLKGSGWYVTDFRDKDKPKSDDKSETKPSAKKSDDKSSSDSSQSSTKSSEKSDGKSTSDSSQSSTKSTEKSDSGSTSKKDDSGSKKTDSSASKSKKTD